VRYELCDVSDHDDIVRLAGTLAGSPIDILINNAGMSAPFFTTSSHDVHITLSIEKPGDLPLALENEKAFSAR
jgi:NAD(P)-dependent dehydrogenase (short-subunit alcohol dehydrogenase family)